MIFEIDALSTLISSLTIKVLLSFSLLSAYLSIKIDNAGPRRYSRINHLIAYISQSCLLQEPKHVIIMTVNSRCPPVSTQFEGDVTRSRGPPLASRAMNWEKNSKIRKNRDDLEPLFPSDGTETAAGCKRRLIRLLLLFLLLPSFNCIFTRFREKRILKDPQPTYHPIFIHEHHLLHAYQPRSPERLPESSRQMRFHYSWSRILNYRNKNDSILSESTLLPLFLPLLRCRRSKDTAMIMNDISEQSLQVRCYFSRIWDEGKQKNHVAWEKKER